MADDNTSRSYRSKDQSRRAQPSSAQASSDPLAELARLIGQSDPFADFGRDSREQQQQQPQPKAPSPPMADWRKAAAAMPAYEPLPEERAEETVRRQPPMRTEPRFDALPPPEPSYQRHDPYQMSSPAEEPADAHDDRYYRNEPQLAADPYQREETEPYHQRHGADAYHQHQQDDRAYAAPAPDAREQQPYFEEGAVMTPHDEESYDDPPRARRHGGLLTAVTLIGCAMIGTAGAYGYRTYYVAPSGSKSPPVITADTRPDKVVSAGENPTGKVITSRVGEPGQNERVVSREEQPVEIRTPPASGPRVVLPAPVAPSQSQSVFPPPPGAIQPPAASGPGGGPAATGSATGNGEAKRIRTVTIRPDGNDLSGRPVGGAGQPSTPAARLAPAPKATPPAARGNSNTGPISLDPQASASAQPTPAPRDRQALQPPAPQAASPQAPVQPPAPRVANVQPNDGATGSTGRYAVQLSSQRSEAEAQAAFRSLQAKYPSQLGGRSSFVKRVEISGKGTFYRAMVGPFSSSAEASQFCSDFKAAGGQCLVPRD
jgi:hypothetical protein